jgi:hypothetical protein
MGKLRGTKVRSSRATGGKIGFAFCPQLPDYAGLYVEYENLSAADKTLIRLKVTRWLGPSRTQ